MSAALEQCLIQHLMDLDSMEVLAREGFSVEVIPTQEFRLVYEYALRYFFESGRTRAVTVEALQTYEMSAGRAMSDMLEDLGVPFKEDPDVSIEDVIEKLIGQYVLKQVQVFNRELATAMVEARIEDRLSVAQEAATGLISICTKLEGHRTRVDAREALGERLAAYEYRAANPDRVEGISFGLKPVDDHTHHIHPGELAVFAAYAKFGKSYFLDMIAVNEWRKRRAVILYTLENAIDMTLDRLACVATTVDSERWQKGLCTPDEIQKVREQVDVFKKSDIPFYVLQPDSGARTVQAMVRQAQVLEGETLLIDQLSHVEHPDPARKPRNEVVRDIMQDLHVAISDTRSPIACLIAHQTSRDGKKNADKRGWYEMQDLAESSEVERSADWVFTGYQSNDAVQYNTALLQILAARRVDLKWWDMHWSVAIGSARIRNERKLFAAA